MALGLQSRLQETEAAILWMGPNILCGSIVMDEQSGSQHTGPGELDINETVNLPIEWQIPDDMVTRYVTNVVVQSGEHEFIISFFEAKPPLLVGGPEEIRAKLSKVESIPATCVARIVVSAERMPGIVQALQANLERRNNSKTSNEGVS